MSLFLLTETSQILQVAVLEENRLSEFFVERKDRRSLVGNIYKGKVRDVLPGMDAAFVDIGWERTAYLFVSDVSISPFMSEEMEWEEEKGKPSIEKLLHEGEERMVQVVRDPIGTKGPRLTSFITLPGRYLVLMPYSNHIGVSRRISSFEERKRLRQIAKEIKPPDVGVIVRTLAEGKNREELFADLKNLLRTWKGIKNRFSRSPSPSLIYEEWNLAEKTVRDFFLPERDKIITDSLTLYRKLKKIFPLIFPYHHPSMELYRGREDLFIRFGIDKELEKALKPVVPLPSGGYITIHETEALVSIDVNTGKYTGEESLEETAFRTNMEAVEEIVHQIRLRNLAGIIVVDFIDMRSRSHRKKLENYLEELLKKDRAHTQISHITQFGLVQMTREKTGPSLAQLLCEDCPTCKGSGRIKSLLTILGEMEKKIRKILREKREKKLRILLNIELYRYIMDKNIFHKYRRWWGHRIYLERGALPWGEYKILNSKGEEIA